MKLYAAFTTLLCLLALILATAGCVGLPTVEPTMTPDVMPTSAHVILPTPTPTPVTVTITGNVWLRDAGDVEHGYLAAGSVVEAFCVGEWCYLTDGSELRFWRGCSSNNPEQMACRMR